MPEPLPRVSVLLVDDRRENLLALEAALAPLGHRLVLASSGDQALSAVLKEQFAVILMDIRMPGLDGFETIALLKQRERSRHIPIIFISGLHEDHHVLRSYASGAVDYILKPVDVDALRSKVTVFATLRQQQIALELAQAELEARVVARTAELAAANDALAREIVQRKAAEKRLYDRAFHDDLTGLANRALFTIHLGRAVARARRRPEPGFAVLMMDLDRFKKVNDTLGHPVGDGLLIAFARRLEDCLREVDTAARLGGDEFAVLLDGITDQEDAMLLAGRIEQALAIPFEIEGKEILASASIGIAMMSPRSHSGEDLLRDADAALYAAKEAGRARARIFDVAMQARVTAHLTLGAELRHAIDHAELRPFFQPIVAVEDGAVHGFEVLCRWQHPTLGLLRPADFLPVALETGLIRAVGTRMLEEACRSAVRWRDAGLDGLQLSVNLSVRELGDPGLPEEVERILQRTGAKASCLALELTEGALLAHGPGGGQTLSRLASLGLSIIIDDYGGGRSRLRDLHAVPISTLKIDASFLANAAEEGSDLIATLIAIAHSLGKKVVAKGVESAVQLELLRAQGCDLAQGDHLSAPLDAAAAEAFARSRPRG